MWIYFYLLHISIGGVSLVLVLHVYPVGMVSGAPFLSFFESDALFE